jgi:hypothetical protein
MVQKVRQPKQDRDRHQERRFFLQCRPTNREKIIKANPFLERFTVADLRNWAEPQMRIPGS